MWYCKDFNSLAVLSLYEGELLGVVDKLYFDKSLKKLLVVELIGEDGARIILQTKNIYHIGKNAITVKNNQAVSLKSDNQDLYLAPINSKVYSINGEFKGVVGEIAFNEKFLCEKIVLENGDLLDVKDVARCGKNTIIFHSKEQKVNLKQFIPKQPKVFKKKDVKIVSALPIETKDDKQPTINKAINQNTDFLVGRVCGKDIFNFNNELLIKAHSIINAKNLKEIKKFGKLRELMLYTL